MGLWTYAELATGICISCLPVIPKFFHHFGPKLSGALTILQPRAAKESADNGSASAARSRKAKAEKLTLPGFKQTFASFLASDAEEKDEHGLYDRHALPKKDYALLAEGVVVPRREGTV